MAQVRGEVRTEQNGPPGKLLIGKRITLIDPEEAGWGGLDWIYLTQDNDQRHDIVRTVTVFAAP